MKIKSLLLTLIALSLVTFTGCQVCDTPCPVPTGLAPGTGVSIVNPATSSEGQSFAEVGKDGSIKACPGVKDDGKTQECSEISVNQN
jgi:hypothetical protein